MPTVSRVAEPYVAIVRFAHDVVLVDGSVIVDAHVPIDVHTAIDVHVGTAIDVHMGTPIDVRACMAATVMPTTVVTSSMTFTVAFRIRRCHNTKSERRSDRKDETKLLQHFCFAPGLQTMSSYSLNKFGNAC